MQKLRGQRTVKKKAKIVLFGFKKANLATVRKLTVLYFQ